MRIEALRREQENEAVRVVATVIWEDCDRAPMDIFFETRQRFSRDMACDPHAFLVACVIPAMRHGEKRVAISQPICPELRSGLYTAMSWLRHWYGKPREMVQIEAGGDRTPHYRQGRRHAGSFLSGGVDSLALLRRNHLDLSPNHPRYIRDCLFVHGFDIGGSIARGRETDAYQRALLSLSRVAKDANVTLIPVATNVRHLDDDVRFWIDAFFGAALASAAHAFSKRLGHVSIACGLDIPNVEPHGSHPLLDANYSSTDLQIGHKTLLLSRLDKVRVVANWDVALNNLRVCPVNPSDGLNCGACEKCIRTMMELLAVGKLDEATTFPSGDVSADLLNRITMRTAYEVAFYEALIPHLNARGRQDLVKVLDAKRRAYHRHVAWREERDWKGAVKRLDRRFLGGGLHRAWKRLRLGVPPHLRKLRRTRLN